MRRSPPPTQSAVERLLAFLRTQAFPVDVRDLAAALGWSRQRVLQVLARVLAEPRPRVIRTRGEGRGEGGGAGRPAALFASSCQPQALRQLVEMGLRVEPNRVVLTCTDRRARVLGVDRHGFVELQYLDGTQGEAGMVTLHFQHLRPWQAGREAPPPVRVAA